MRISGALQWSAVFVYLALVPKSFPQNAKPPAPAPASPATLPTPRHRPTIGVALEGGGALGLAHIGVLQWFEDHHIPIDYLAGTSMGGLVGGLYALGKSPEQLKQIVVAQDWNRMIGGETSYADLSYRRKQDAAAYPNALQLGLKSGLALPSGLSSGEGVSLLIDRETLAYAHSGSFNDFPIPFRCVATDLTTAKAVVFDHGSIAQAMRATMSLPGIFAPVRDGDNVYVDGGLLGNLPTDVVRGMGADIVIAVHLETAPVDPRQIQSIFSVLGRSIETVIHQNEIRGLSQADLIITAQLQDFTAMQYDRAGDIMARGSQAAKRKEQVLAPYELNDSDWQDYLEQRRRRTRTAIPEPEYVEVRGTAGDATKELQAYLQPLANKPVDVKQTESVLSQLTGTGKYDAVNYWLSENDNRTGLIVSVQEKGYAPPTLQLGFLVDGSEPSVVTFTQAARLTLMDVGGYRSEWRTDFAFGNTYALSTEYYRPFTALGKWFFAPQAEASDAGVRFFNKNRPVAFYRFEHVDAGLDLGYEASRFTELRAGYRAGYLNQNLTLGTPDFASIDGRLGETHLQIATDHTDDPVVPGRGYSGTTTFHWYDAYPGAFDTLPAMDAHLEGFLPVSSRGSLFATAEGASTFGFINTGFPLYFLGGPMRLSAYGTNELYGEQYYLFRAGYHHDLFTLPPFVGKKVYAIGSYEAAKMYRFTGESGFPNDVEAGILAETAFGPLFLGGSIGDSGHRKWFFQLGKVF